LDAVDKGDMRRIDQVCLFLVFGRRHGRVAVELWYG
jgi:hypothetical protein